ncbi:MAG: hypothetical protein LJE95_11150 [Acidobacteria bacterium]|jgi:hypothetical protein|nr:hypothetical protein [Acidobacteriota bacterium]
MSDTAFKTVEELIDGIINGRVPRQIRLFAAQGLLPVSREELLRLQLILSTDPDKELATLAHASVAEQDVDVLLHWVADETVPPLELELLVRIRDEESIWAKVAAHPNTSDQTLRILARHAGHLVQDIIITNQVRLLGCLDILEDLRANPKVDSVILRRVHEFEDEFIAKAAQLTETPESGPSVDEALHALQKIGAHLPGQDRLAVPGLVDAELAEEVEREGKSAFSKILLMNTYEKIMTALKGSREERAILVNSRNNLVAKAVLASPKLSDNEIDGYAASRSVTQQVIRTIAENPRWLRRYSVVVSLAGNPKTPVQVAMRLLPRLNERDLKRISFDRNVPPPVRQQAGRVRDRRR